MSIDPHGDLTAGVGRILIVDDEPYIREILSRWLIDEGYEWRAGRRRCGGTWRPCRYKTLH